MKTRQYIYFWVDREEKPREIGGGWRDCSFGSGFLDVDASVPPDEVCLAVRNIANKPNANVVLYQADAVMCLSLPENSAEVREELLTVPMTALYHFGGSSVPELPMVPGMSLCSPSKLGALMSDSKPEVAPCPE